MVRITPALLVFLASPVVATDCQVDGYGSAYFAGDVDDDSLYKPVTMWGKRMGTLEMCKELCECTRNCGCFRYVDDGDCLLYKSDKCTANDAKPTCDEIKAGYHMRAFLRDAGNVPEDDPDAGVFRRGSRGDTSVPSAAQCVMKKFRTAQHFNNAYKLLGNFDESADDYSLMSCGYYYGYWVGGKYDGKWDKDGYKEDVVSAEECAAHCDKTHGCAGFVWFDEKAYSGAAGSWVHRCVPYTEAHWCDQGIYTDTTRSGHRGWSYWRAAGPSTAPMPGAENGDSGDIPTPVSTSTTASSDAIEVVTTVEITFPGNLSNLNSTVQEALKAAVIAAVQEVDQGDATYTVALRPGSIIAVLTVTGTAADTAALVSHVDSNPIAVAVPGFSATSTSAVSAAATTPADVPSTTESSGGDMAAQANVAVVASISLLAIGAGQL